MTELGEVLRLAAESLRRVLQASDAIIGGALLAAASLATQALADVEIDGRRIFLSLWFLNVAESGERKSAVDSEVMRAAREYEHNLAKQYEERLPRYLGEKEEYNAKRDAAKEDAKKKKGKGLAEALAELGKEPEAPLLAQITVADFTAEGLFKLLQAGQPSIGAFTDEAALVVGGHGMARETIMRTAGALSRLWDRGEMDRIRSGDGAQKLYDRRFALHLLAQPVIAMRAMSDDVLAGQGFLARCLMAWPQGTAGNRSYVAESLRDDPAMTHLHETLLALHNQPKPLAALSTLAAGDDDGSKRGNLAFLGDDDKRTAHSEKYWRQELAPPALVLTTDAKELWCELYDTIERGMAQGGPFAQVKPWASKMADQALRIAGVLTLVENREARQIDAATIRRAGELALWYLGEAVRLVGTAELSPEVCDAEMLRAWCHETKREYLHSSAALRLGPARIRERKRFLDAVLVLVSAGWAQPVKGGMDLDGRHRRHVWRILPDTEGEA